MLREIKITADGSSTVSIPSMHVTYHSIHGAMQESKHVFIEAGLKPLLNKHKTLCIFEMGFGTGLNAMLTLQEAISHQQKIYYYTSEAFPLIKDEVSQLNYTAQSNTSELKNNFVKMHESEWEKDVEIHPLFMLHKTTARLENISFNNSFHLIYFDAFAPSVQPELWTKENFDKLFSALEPEGILVTYCSKGDVRRAMLAAGFNVEKLKGPSGKREMLRAIKL